MTVRLSGFSRFTGVDPGWLDRHAGTLQQDGGKTDQPYSFVGRQRPRAGQTAIRLR